METASLLLFVGQPSQSILDVPFIYEDVRPGLGKGLQDKGREPVMKKEPVRGAVQAHCPSHVHITCLEEGRKAWGMKGQLVGPQVHLNLKISVKKSFLTLISPLSLGL